MKVAIYLRVSSPKKFKDEKKSPRDNPFLQNPEVQLDPLKKLVEFREWELFKVYQDRMTGSKGAETRPGYRELWEDAKKGCFKAVVVWRFDRFARTLKELIISLDEFKALGIEFISSMEHVDTTTPMGKAMFGMLGVFAEFERASTIERTLAGIARAREHGTKSGKSIGRQRKTFRRDLAEEMRLEGKSLREIGKALNVPHSTVAKALREQGVQQPSLAPLPLGVDSEPPIATLDW